MRKIIELLKKQVDTAGERLAVHCEDSEYTYAELWRRSLDFSDLIRSQLPGERRDLLIGILTERETVYFALMFAILHAGAAFMPLDTGNPDSRIQTILDDSAAPALLVDRTNLYRVRHAYRQCVELNNIFLLTEPVTVTKRVLPPSDDDLLYGVYTSGSTGKPKGVLIDEAGFVSLIAELHRLFYPADGQLFRVAVFAPFSFDLSLQQIMPALLGGHSLYVAPRQERIDGRSIVQYVNRHRIDLLEATPSHLDLIILCQNSFERITHPVSIISIGEVLKLSTVKKLYSQLGGLLTLYNFYGPTECTVASIAYPVPLHRLGELQEIPLGQPIRNTGYVILDEQDQPCATGKTGELCLTGACVGRGYVSLAEGVRNGYQRLESGESIFRTGDQAFQGEDGLVYFRGRKDNQVKINSFRIELGEVEAALAAVPGLDQVCVLPVRFGGKDQLAAFYSSAAAVPVPEVRAQLKDRIPAYMIPQYYQPLAVMPTNNNGKIDRKQLRALFRQTDSQPQPAEDLTEVQLELAAMIREILELPSEAVIGLNDSFFALGGDSLSVFELICAIHDRYRVELTLADVYRDNSLRQLEQQISAAQGIKKQGPRRPLLSDRLPASIMESFFLGLPAAFQNLIYLSCTFQEPVEPTEMRQAALAVLSRRAAARTWFYPSGSRYLKRLEPGDDTVADKVVTVEPADISPRLLEISLPLPDLQNYFRCFISSRSMALVYNHALLDVNSGRILLDEIRRAHGGEVMLDDAALSGDYVEEQKRFSRSRDFRERLEALSAAYHQQPAFDLKAMLQPANRAGTARLAAVLNDVEREQLRRSCAQLHCTPFALILASFLRVLAEDYNCRFFPVGIFNDGRFRQRYFNLAGNLAFPVPFALEIPQEQSFSETVTNVSQQLSFCAGFQALSLPELRAAFSPEMQAAWPELFAATVNYHHLNIQGSGSPVVSSVDLAENRSQPYGLNLEIEESPGKVALIFSGGDYFDQQHLQRIREGISTRIAASAGEETGESHAICDQNRPAQQAV